MSVTAFSLSAQIDEGFIYGKVTTIGGSTYQGQIRLGEKEVFWNDLFYATKTSNAKNTYSKYAPDKKGADWWNQIDGKILKIWDDRYSSQTHQFSCQYGDIQSVFPLDEGQLICELKNRIKIRLLSSPKYIGESILINDYELGKVHLKWDKIQSVQFEDTPKTIVDKLGDPLYGTVYTSEGDYTGFIQWDKDERIGSDLLQGSQGAIKVAIPFKKIETIENQGNSCKVALRGKHVYILGGTNDVNSENRGIVVSIEEIGKVEIPWGAFGLLKLEENVSSSGQSFGSFGYPKRLEGIVKDLEGNEYKGLIIFDKDEKWDVEQLEGTFKSLKYIIPFRKIKTIIPKNESYSYIILKNDQKLILGNLQDVSSKNEGVVIIQRSSREPAYLDWEKVDEIHFH